MILANLNGDMRAVRFVRETEKAYIYNDLSMNGDKRKKDRRLPKDSINPKLFKSTDEALDWMGITL